MNAIDYQNTQPRAFVEEKWIAVIREDNIYKITERGKNNIQAKLTEVQLEELGKALLKTYAHCDESWKDKRKVISCENYDIFVEIEEHMLVHAEIHETELKNSYYAKENNLLGEPCIASIDCSSFALLDLPSIISDILFQNQ